MIPDVALLCAAGERAFANDEFEEAEAWYELACAGRYCNPHPQRTTIHDALLPNRFARWEEIRTRMFQRSVRRLTTPDSGHLVFVQTCSGREQMLDRTMKSLGAAGALPSLNVLCDHNRDGEAKTFFRILQAAASYPRMTALTLFEDDIVLAKNAFDYIATTRIDPDLAFVSWFSIYYHGGYRLPPLLSCFLARDYSFHQAITFPARTVHELLASDVLKNWPEPHNADRMYKDIFPMRKVAVHYPNLAQHVGGTDSAVGNNKDGPRLSLTFIGEDTDALDLLAK